MTAASSRPTSARVTTQSWETWSMHSLQGAQKVGVALPNDSALNLFLQLSWLLLLPAGLSLLCSLSSFCLRGTLSSCCLLWQGGA